MSGGTDINGAPRQAAAAGCLVCGGAVSVVLKGVFDTRFGAEGSYDIGECSSCGLLQLSPPPSPGELKRLYVEYYNFGGSRKGAYTGARRLFFSSLASRLWAALDGDVSFYTRKGNGRLLDVGCNEGRGLEIYRKNGFQAEGLELNEKAAATASGRGFKVHTVPLCGFMPERPFDVVVFSNVLEHALDPLSLLRDANRVLRPGGELWVSCPNAESWQKRVFSRSWINWHAPFHTVHFSGKNLSALIEGAGFGVSEIRNVSPALWMASSMIAMAFARHGRPTSKIRNPVLLASLMLFARCFLFPALWLGNLLGKGDCLVASALKK